MTILQSDVFPALAAKDEPVSTLVYVSGGGRFGNQLSVFSHLIALACEYPHLRILQYKFWPYANLCEGTALNPSCRFPAPPPTRSPWLPRLAEGARKSFPKLYGHYGQVAIERLLRRQVIADRKFDQPWLLDSSNIQDFLARLRPGFQFIAGFRLRCTPLFEKHQAAIRRFLQPAMPYRAQSEAFLAPLRRRYEKLVGLMIRQTDYRTFRDGRYFMDTEQYRVLVHQILDRFGPDTGIVAASDEPQVPDAFAGLPVHLCSGAAGLGGHYIESFTQLGMCDAVVSVPSTFSLWATFMGRTPLLMLPAGRPDLDAAVWMDSAMIEGRHRPELATFLY